MAELTLSCPKVISTGGGGETATGVDIQRKVLVRTGGCFEQNTVLDITAPGDGWAVFGDPVTFSGSTEFTELTQVFRNGVIQLTAGSAGVDNDVYFVSASGSIGFEYNIQTNDVVQVWKFNPTTTSG